jgi:hypothetical protein
MSGAGVISGIPTTAAKYSFTVQVRDSAASAQAAQALLSITVVSAASGGTVLWSADSETGNLSQWFYPSTSPTGSYGGGEYNSGNGDSVASRDFAHSGVWSTKLTISASGAQSGTRLFRWMEPRANSALHYRTWYYFPKAYRAPNWWSVMQWKSKTPTRNDPFFMLDISTASDGSMRFYLYDWQRRVSYKQAAKTIPVGQWFKVEAFYRCSADGTGRVTIWQDGIQLFDVPASTRYSDGDCEWAVINYSDSVSPAPTSIYIDDVAIIKK